MTDLSLTVKISFILLGLGFILHFIAFASPYWHNSETELLRLGHYNVHYGLWRYCNEQRISSRTIKHCIGMVSGDYVTDYIRANQFFQTVGFLAAILSIVLLSTGECVATCRDRRILPLLSGVCASASAVCVILGCIIFGAKESKSDSLSWAFALAIIGGFFFAVSGVVILVGIIFLKR